MTDDATLALVPEEANYNVDLDDLVEGLQEIICELEQVLIDVEVDTEPFSLGRPMYMEVLDRVHEQAKRGLQMIWQEREWGNV